MFHAILGYSVGVRSIGVWKTLILRLLDIKDMLRILNTDPGTLTVMVKRLVTVVLLSRTLPRILLTITWLVMSAVGELILTMIHD